MENITIDTKDLSKIGSNIEMVQQGNLLILVIDTSKELGMSKSGASMAIASTEGMMKLPEKKMLNVWYGRKL